MFENGYCTTPQGLRFEAKGAPEACSFDDVLETYSSFANTDGGVIAIGLKETDSGLEVEGVPGPGMFREELWDVLNDTSRVSVNLLTRGDVEICDVDGRTVVLVRVPRADRRDRPVFLGGSRRNCYRRLRDTDRRCTPEEVESMVADALASVTDGDVVPRMEVGDLDGRSVSEFREEMGRLRPDHPWNVLDDGRFLVAIGAAAMDGDVCRPTVAGSLMFGTECGISRMFPGYGLEYREYGESDVCDFSISSRSGDWSGNVYGFYRRVTVRTGEVVGRSPQQRADSDASRLEACLDEILVNALVNADYRSPGAVTVEWRDGDISVVNPGCLRLPLERAVRGGFSDPRNVTLACMFSLIRPGMQAGHGIQRTVASCSMLGLAPPRFSEDYDPCRVTVTLSTSKTDDNLKAYIVDAMTRDPRVTLSEIAASLDVKRSLVEKVINQLKDEGSVVRVGGRRGTWMVDTDPGMQ